MQVAVIIAVVVVAVAMIGMAASTTLLSSPEAASQDPQAIAPKVTDESESETLEDHPRLHFIAGWHHSPRVNADKQDT